MTHQQFGEIVAYITAGMNLSDDKQLSAPSLKVYFDCLGDLDFTVLLMAAKRVMLEHRWSNFPSIAELREAAAETARGQVKALSSAEAWSLAWAAVARIDPEREYTFTELDKLPPLVVKAIRAFGLQTLCYGNDPVSVLRGQFMKTYEQLAEREKREALMSPAMRQAIEGIGRKVPALPVKVAGVLAGIGQPVE